MWGLRRRKLGWFPLPASRVTYLARHGRLGKLTYGAEMPLRCSVTHVAGALPQRVLDDWLLVRIGI